METPQSRQFIRYQEPITWRYSSINNNPTLHTLLINLASNTKIIWDWRPNKVHPIRCVATFGTSDNSCKAFFTFKKEILLQHTKLKGWISLTSCWLEEIQEFFCPYQQVSRLSGLNLEKMREGFTFRTQRKLSVITSVIRPVLNRRPLSGVRQCTSITKYDEPSLKRFTFQR